jgi:lon-related putative ATP-dependent protease
MRSGGFDVFAMGPEETGKKTFLSDLLGRRAAEEAPPPDLCCLHNFRETHRPHMLRVAAGRGRTLRADLRRLVEDLRITIPAALQGEEVAARRRALEEEVKEENHRAFEDLRSLAEGKGVAFLRTPMGLGFAPMAEGEVLTPEQVANLSPEERKKLKKELEDLEAKARDLLAKLRAAAQEAREKEKELLRGVMDAAVAHLIEELKSRHGDVPGIPEHLESVHRDVIENVEAFMGEAERVLPEADGAGEPAGLPGAPFRRYLLNLLVDNGDLRGAPVVHERHPTLANLVGRIEHAIHQGALLTDFHLVRAGALHRAQGGYLLLDARTLLLQPYAWEALKRALASRELHVETPGQVLGLASTVTLEPEVVPLDLKVVLVGDRYLYHLLDALDPEFHSLFKVVADFSDEVERTPENEGRAARDLAAAARRHGLRPLEPRAMARVLERSARAVGDAGRLSAHMGSLVDLLREADRCAAEAGRDVVGEEEVRRAVRAQETREGRIRELLLREIREGTILLDTAGRRVGQVNGLAVLQVGRLAFGRPNRITARVRLGRGEVVDIERAVELSGPFHSKGVMILSGFLGARYAPDHLLSLRASLVFEQSYGRIDGDSASCAELCALLSALGGIPLAQGLAVTGSVNQHGEVQPVGGVDEKIEGFFDACSARGLTGDQGVIVPAANAGRLMLREDVVEAARGGRFRVFAAATVDEIMEILTGLPAGERGKDGRFPAGSVNGLVEDRLVALADRRRDLARREDEEARA